MELKDKKVLVVGLGSSGLSAAKLCLAKGARVTANDLNPDCPVAGELEALGAEVVLGEHRQDDFTSAELVVLSPGVDPRMEQVAAAKQAGAQVIGELELGYRFLKAPSLMITGTNGKSTVTTLAGDMLKASGFKTFVGGNLGAPLCDYVSQEQKADWAVLEVSSFQLDTASSLRPRVGLLLNISPDHQDRYQDFEEYARSKYSLFARQAGDDLALLCADDRGVSTWAGLAQGRHLAYGMAGPRRPGGWLDGKDVMLNRDGEDIRLSTAKSALPGKINRLNIISAALAALHCGANPQAMQEAIDAFSGLPHRIQFVANVDGVDYYDDSKGTNVGAVVAAVRCLNRPMILLLGGRDKGGVFKDLRPVMNNKVKRVLCFGEAGPDIHRQIHKFAPSEEAGSMAQALERARKLAQPKQVVLLSPGCASFDAYKNYGQRGDHFQDMVKEAAHG